MEREVAVAKDKVDVQALYAALSAKRQAEQMSWRQLAQKIGISASTMTRLAQGQRPDVDAFATLIRWLGLPAEQFITPSDTGVDEPDILIQIVPLLRARSDLSPSEIEYLEEIIGA